MTGLGCEKALWDSPGRDPGARGRRNFDNFRIQLGGPSRIHGGGGIHGRSARRCVGSHRVLPMCSGGHLVAGRMGRRLLCVVRRVGHQS